MPQTLSAVGRLSSFQRVRYGRFDSNTHIKKAIFSKDYSSLLADAAESSTLRHVLTVAASQEGSWSKFWDHALDKGAAGSSGTLGLLKL